MVSLTATGFMCVFNEADILPFTLRHLLEQGLRVHVIDNWSTDGSDEIARTFPLCGFERFPVTGASRYFSWAPLLRRVEALAQQSDSDWCVHHDADEIRRSSRRGESLIDGFARANNTGYNAIDFRVYRFPPVDDDYNGDPEKHFRFFVVDDVPEVRAWRNSGHRVDLAATGGHIVRFPGVKVFPEKFVMKHYPLRSSEHASRKVLRERLARYDPIERSRKWHRHYDALARKQVWLSDPKDLLRWTDSLILPPSFGATK